MSEYPAGINTTTPGAEGHRNEMSDGRVVDDAKDESNELNQELVVAAEWDRNEMSEGQIIDDATDGADNSNQELVVSAEWDRNEMSDGREIETAEPVVQTVPAVNPPMSTPSVTPSISGAPFKVVVLNGDNEMNDAATDQADKRLDKELGEGSRFSRFLKGIWKGGILKDRYRQRYISEAKDAIKASQDALMYETGTNQSRADALQAKIERFQSGYDDLIHKDAGEKREIIRPDSEFAKEIKSIIRDYCEGRLDDVSLREERTRLLEKYREELGPDNFKAGVVSVDNLLDIAMAVKGATEHGESLDNIMTNMQIIGGETRDGVRSEAKHNSIDKILSKMASSGFGALATSEVFIGALTIASSLVRVGSHSLVGAAMKTVLPGVGAGLWAGLRENRRLTDERTQHSREMAQGKQIEDNSTRRLEIDKTRYESTYVGDLIGSLKQVGAESTLNEGGNDALRAAINVLALVETRIKLSDQRNIDLISYSDSVSIGRERMMLDYAKIDTKAALARRMNSAKCSELGYISSDLQAIIDSESASIKDVIESGIAEKDKSFNQLKARRIAKAALVGTVSGITLGILSQEIVASFDPTRAGLIEQIWDGNNVPINDTQHETLLHGLLSGEHSTTATGTSEVIKQAYNEAHINRDMSQAEIDQYHQAGMVVEDNSNIIMQPVTHSQEVSAHDFAANSENSIRVTRSWFDNDTKIFDKNELRMDWGGENNSGVTAAGDYQFSVSRMMEDGSYHDGSSVDWHQAAAGETLKIAISATKDTQSEVFLFDIDTSGKVNIPVDSPVAQLFSLENGKAVFHGAYAEAVQVGSIDVDDVTHIQALATVVGENNAGNITETITEDISVRQPDFLVITPEIKEIIPVENIVENFTEMAPVIPIQSRKSLESLIESKLRNPEVGPMYYGSSSMEDLRQWVKDKPELIKTRVGIKDDKGHIVSWVEADGSPVERRVDRERSVISEYLNKENQINPNHHKVVEKIADFMGPMSEKCRVAINVPAWMEGKNIEHWLSQFSVQTDKNGEQISIDKYELNVIVNRKTGTPADDSVEVIKRFIEDRRQSGGEVPHVNYYDIELDPPMNNVGYARKLITDAVLLRSVRRSNQDGCLYIETEDADVVRADNRTVINLIEKLDNNPQLDAVRGVQDRDPSQLKENDYLFMRRRAWDFFEILARQKRFRDSTNPNWNYTWNRTVTGGWNTGYTAEAYANIGGYDSVVSGEDMLIGQKISMVRGDGNTPNLDVIGTIGTRSDSSPRRFIQEIVQGKGAYEDFGNEAANQEIREKSIPELMRMISNYSRLNDTNKDSFANYLNVIPSWSADVTGGSNYEAEKMTERIMFMLGFKKGDYTLDMKNRKMIFKNWANFSNSLKRYRSNYASR